MPVSAELIRFSNKLQFDINNYKYIVVFPKSKSGSYPIVVELISSVQNSMIDYGKSEYHIACFNKTVDDIQVLKTVLDLINNIKNSLLFVDFQKQSIWTMSLVLKCFLTASKCNDYRAHCWNTEIYTNRQYINADDSPFSNMNNVIVRCKKMTTPCAFAGHFRPFHISSEIKIEDAYQAFSIKQNAYLCPLFDINNFKYEDYSE